VLAYNFPIMATSDRPRRLRRDGTPAERLLWRHLRNRGLRGAKFRRQHRIGRYIVDFVCEEAALVVEIDGGQHALEAERDDARTRDIERHGYRVVRFWNNEVTESLEGVLDTIAAELDWHRG
jgi:very-short-patch-repair endonuclease